MQPRRGTWLNFLMARNGLVASECSKSNMPVARFIRRHVAIVYAHKYGSDYFESFSLVVRCRSFKMLSAFAVQNVMNIYETNVLRHR